MNVSSSKINGNRGVVSRQLRENLLLRTTIGTIENKTSIVPIFVFYCSLNKKSKVFKVKSNLVRLTKYKTNFKLNF